jgi:hypothetical protein
VPVRAVGEQVGPLAVREVTAGGLAGERSQVWTSVGHSMSARVLGEDALASGTMLQ